MKTKILSIAAAGLLLLAACTGKTMEDTADSSAAADSVNKDTSAKTIKPSEPAPAWAPSIKPEMQAVIEKLASYGDKPIPELSAKDARKNHTPTDAVMDLMAEHNIPKPVFNVDTMGKDVLVEGGSVHVRIYTPKTDKTAYPVIVYYHGGGFVIANLDVYDASANVLADKTEAIVVSVAYRLTPEHKFPIAHNDAYAAYEWVLKNAASFKGDAKKVAVAGESAGGNLAINTAIKARDNKVMIPTAILAVYPVAGSDMNTPSYKKNEMAKPLDKPMMMWFVKNYLKSTDQATDPRINLVAANLKGLPPTTIITAEIDPLQSEGMLLGDKLKAAGVAVDSKNYDGVTHEFFGMGAIVPQAMDAEMYAVEQLKKAFGM
ncbi:alpha/beta hydrolase [Mucilaginibacter calamicampi]|uniref:Alpha/beta hydrolase n=1 Tax=Mucilaginibacter calamicampi TaxID=1302352 RepID=A0ABW2Z112_9SPHI